MKKITTTTTKMIKMMWKVEDTQKNSTLPPSPSSIQLAMEGTLLLKETVLGRCVILGTSISSHIISQPPQTEDKRHLF